MWSIAIQAPLCHFPKLYSQGHFSRQVGKANVIPIFKKDKKHLVKNYRPISLLPIFAKIFERIIFKDLYNHLMSNKLITENQSGFIKGDSTINQLLSITHMIHQSFDCDVPKEVRSVFLDISKAFDKIWHIEDFFSSLNRMVSAAIYLHLLRTTYPIATSAL